jgi:hypothetical protein
MCGPSIARYSRLQALTRPPDPRFAAKDVGDHAQERPTGHRRREPRLQGGGGSGLGAGGLGRRTTGPRPASPTSTSTCCSRAPNAERWARSRPTWRRRRRHQRLDQLRPDRLPRDHRQPRVAGGLGHPGRRRPALVLRQRRADQELEVVLEELRRGNDTPSRVASENVVPNRVPRPPVPPPDHRLRGHGQELHPLDDRRLLRALVPAAEHVPGGGRRRLAPTT